MTPKKLLALLLCAALPASASAAVTVKGSDTMVILNQRWAEAYMSHNPGSVIQVTGGGSGTGISALIGGSTDICASSRHMKDKERGELSAATRKEAVEIAVAKDGVAVFLNESNPVTELTLAQIKGIYRGKITNWKEVGGPDKRIIVYSRENNSGTYVFFKDHVLGGKDFTPFALTLPGTAAVANAVGKDKQGEDPWDDPVGIEKVGVFQVAHIPDCAAAPTCICPNHSTKKNCA
jgi:phosphate transport system substrate-binding protein